MELSKKVKALRKKQCLSKLYAVPLEVLLDDKQELEFGGDKQSEPVIPQKQRKKKCVSIIIGFIIILLFGITLFQFWKKNSNEMPVDAIPGEKVETEIIQNFDLEWK